MSVCQEMDGCCSWHQMGEKEVELCTTLTSSLDAYRLDGCFFTAIERHKSQEDLVLTHRPFSAAVSILFLWSIVGWLRIYW